MTPRPYTLVAELTYRCPLRCAYCSNPTDFGERSDRLDEPTWSRVLAEAEALGVMQVHFTGGEPFVRRDLEALVSRAHDLGLYSNVVSSGVGVTRERVRALASAGLDAFQLSIQDVVAEGARLVCGGDWLDDKLAVARWVREEQLPLTLNVVLHRMNIDRVDAFVALAEQIGAERLELANTQYLGWALLNREALIPSLEQLARARGVARAASARLRGKMDVVFVLPDYYADAPKPCMDGWGRRTIVVSPDGLALPCHMAHTIPGLRFGSVLDTPVATLWTSAAFDAFRGESWMGEPCASCERRTLDFGGCRCQAYHLTGDARATDPACAKAPSHHRVVEARRSDSFDVPETALAPRKATASGRATRVKARYGR